MHANPFKIMLPLALFVAVAAQAQSGSDHYLLSLDGLACPFCAYGIEKQLMKIDGVDKLETDVAEGQVEIVMKAGRSLERSRVEQAVKDAGFTLKDFRPAEPGSDTDNGNEARP